MTKKKKKKTLLGVRYYDSHLTRGEIDTFERDHSVISGKAGLESKCSHVQSFV